MKGLKQTIGIPILAGLFVFANFEADTTPDLGHSEKIESYAKIPCFDKDKIKLVINVLKMLPPDAANEVAQKVMPLLDKLSHIAKEYSQLKGKEKENYQAIENEQKNCPPDIGKVQTPLKELGKMEALEAKARRINASILKLLLLATDSTSESSSDDDFNGQNVNTDRSLT